ncbi:MAG: hypothetical protein JWM21_1404 [Acidobacteria bacterium]|nr:hypothetical protein [Acidobacteriota bacterium]
MKLVAVLLACVACLVVVNGRGSLASGVAGSVFEESKTQPKEVVLDKDSQSDKYGEVAFNHENHATKKYDPAGTAVLSCIECHHTDQPAAGLKAPLKTSERNAVLSADLLQAADSKPVKTCRTCHLQAGDDSAPLPVVTYPEKTTPTKLTNEVAYHNNCNICHDKAIAARPALKGKVPGSNDCLPCHKPAS